MTCDDPQFWKGAGQAQSHGVSAVNWLTDEELAALVEQIEQSFEDEIEDLATQLREARSRIKDLEAVIEQGDA